MGIIFFRRKIINNIFQWAHFNGLSHALAQELLLLFDSACSSHSSQSYSTCEVNSAILIPFPKEHFVSRISSSASKEMLFYL